MDESNGGGHGETSDPVDHSHRDKDIPAVADDAFLAEEDEDYDELYGDIYTGPGVKNNEVEPKKPPLPSVQNAGAVSLPGAGGNGQKQPFFGVGVGSSTFFLGNLHWWTTDSDVENELCKYGKVRDLTFFLHDDCGKSKGYCRVEFYDPLDAAACKKGLIGHKFNGRMCVVSSSETLLICMNEADEVEATKLGDGINQGSNGDNRGYGRGNWGRGNNLGMGNRGHGNPVRNWGGGMGGPTGRMGGYAGFPGGPMPPFFGILPSYPGVGLHGLVPYANHSFYGRGMPMYGMGMIPRSGMGGPNMGRWGGDEHGGGTVTGENYGEEAASDHQYDEVDRNRGDSPNAMREKNRGSERYMPGTSGRMFKDDRVHEIDKYVPSENDSEHDHEERRILDDREISRGWSRDHERSQSRDHDRDRHREDRDKYADHHSFKDKSRKYSHNGKRRRINL